jgi:hypothetical protein
MKQDVLHSGNEHHEVHHRRPGHIAEKLESYVGVGIVAVAAVLLAILLFAFMQTGSGVPSYMQ